MLVPIITSWVCTGVLFIASTSMYKYVRKYFCLLRDCQNICIDYDSILKSVKSKIHDEDLKSYIDDEIEKQDDALREALNRSL